MQEGDEQLRLQINPLKYIQYSGSDGKLQQFVESVDGFVPMLERFDAVSLHIFFNAIKSRIDGEAATTLAGHPEVETWDEVKKLLALRFTDWITSEQLLSKFMNTSKTTCIKKFHVELTQIMARLVQRVKLEETDTARFKIKVEMFQQVAVKHFISKMDGTTKAVLLSRQIKNLTEAIQIIIECGLDNDKQGDSFNRPNNFTRSTNKQWTPRNQFQNQHSTNSTTSTIGNADGN